MEFVKLVFVKYILGYLLQSVADVLSIYAFNKKKLERKKFLFATIIFAVSMYLIRKLPIVFGVHTILLLVLLFLLGILFLKCNASLTIFAVLFITVITTVCEILTSLILISIFGYENLKVYISDGINMALVGIPANVLLFFIIYFLYNRKTRSNQNFQYMN